MNNLTTVELLEQQEKRAKSLHEAAARFPKNPPRNDAVPSMFAKLALKSTSYGSNFCPVMTN